MMNVIQMIKDWLHERSMKRKYRRAVRRRVMEEMSFVEFKAKKTAAVKKNRMDDACLSPNGKLKNVGKGKRCFILGNGPSLKTEDLTQLAGEDVFTVNQAARHPDFPILRSKVHLWADRNFFVWDDSKPEDKELINFMKAVNTGDNKPLCFFPADLQCLLEERNLHNELNIRYFYPGVVAKSDQEDIDFTQKIPIFNGVVLYAIALATYMGYSEIYVLGIDTTSILVNIKSFLGKNDDDDYCYSVTSNEKKRLERMLARQTLEQQAESFLKSLRQYRILHEYCERRGIKLVNCSSTTLVESLPRMSLKEVLANK